MEKYRSQEVYETDVIKRFNDGSNEVEILIVVSKLLTGFDAPRNTVLYLAKPLVEHNLLQAIARVNRLFEGKEFGYIIDYVGVLGKLDEALTNYSAFEGFDEEDLKGTVQDIKEEIRKIPALLSDIWDVFKSIESLAEAGIQISAIVKQLTIRDWKKNLDVHRKMENAIEDFLMGHRKDMGLEITFDEIDEILVRCLKVAKNNY